MAERQETITPLTSGKNKSHLVTWSGLLNGDTGRPINMTGSSDRSVQFSGTFGSGGNIVIEGSNDGVAYHTLTDPQGNAISKSAAGLEAITELTNYIRPRVTGGDGNTNLVTSLLMKLV